MHDAKTDGNHTLIAEAARWAGVTVANTHRLGEGFPDQAWGVDGLNLLVEVKTDKGKLTPREAVFHATWRGQLVIVRTPEQAVAEIEKWKQIAAWLKEAQCQQS